MRCVIITSQSSHILDSNSVTNYVLYRGFSSNDDGSDIDEKESKKKGDEQKDEEDGEEEEMEKKLALMKAEELAELKRQIYVTVQLCDLTIIYVYLNQNINTTQQCVLLSI